MLDDARMQRAEGFWWVRLVSPYGDGWGAYEVESDGMGRQQLVVRDCLYRLDMEPAPVAEWGPYLGKEPGGTVRLDELSIEMRGRVRDELEARGLRERVAAGRIEGS